MNSDLFKITFVLVTMPLWLPFAKALVEEFLAAMRGDGGLKGPTLTPRQRKAVEEEIARTEEPRVVSEPLAHVLRRSGLRSGGAGGQSSSHAQAGGRREAERPRGFRS